MQVRCVNCGTLFEPTHACHNLCSRPCRIEYLEKSKPISRKELAKRRAQKYREKKAAEALAEAKRKADNLAANLAANPERKPIKPEDFAHLPPSKFLPKFF